MIQSLAFMSHQLGSFLGAYGGGLIYDSLGSYTMACRIGVALGLAARGASPLDPRLGELACGVRLGDLRGQRLAGPFERLDPPRGVGGGVLGLAVAR